jgi:lysophospholipase L1-like esterase
MRLLASIFALVLSASVATAASGPNATYGTIKADNVNTAGAVTAGTLAGVDAGIKTTTTRGVAVLLPQLIDALQAPVTHRPPSRADTATGSYTVGQHWLNTNGPSNALYKLTSVAAGTVWRPVPSAGLPLDAVPNALWACGTFKLRSGYTGNALYVSRTDTNALSEIGFRADGALDASALDAFLAGNPSHVATCHDQSGNAYDAPQATDSARPTLNSTNTIGSVRSIVFDNTINGSVTIKALPISSSVTGNGTALSVVALMRFGSSLRNSAVIQFTPTTGNKIAFGSYQGTGGFGGVSNMGLLFNNGGGIQYSGFRVPTTPTIAGFSAGSSGGTTVISDDQSVSLLGSPSQPFAGGYVGFADAYSTTGYMEVAAILVYGRTLTATELATVQESLLRASGVTPQVRGRWIADGDSITEGYMASFLQGYPYKAQKLIGRPVKVFNTAYAGDTIANRNNLYATNVAPLYDSAAPFNILSIWAGTNDNDGSDPTCATTYGNLTSYIAKAHATGFKVVTATMLPKNGWSAAQTTQQAACNVKIRANAAGADAIVDAQAQMSMGNPANLNATYTVDGVHPNDLGYDEAAAIWAGAVNGLLGQVGLY